MGGWQINWWVFFPALLIGIVLLGVGALILLSLPMYYRSRAYRQLHEATEQQRRDGRLVDISGFPHYKDTPWTPEEIAAKEAEYDAIRKRSETEPFKRATVGFYKHGRRAAQSAARASADEAYEADMRARGLDPNLDNPHGIQLEEWPMDEASKELLEFEPDRSAKGKRS